VTRGRVALLASALVLVLIAAWWITRSASPPESPLIVNDEPSELPATTEPAAPPKPQPIVIHAVTQNGVAVRIVKPVPLKRPQAPYAADYAALLPLAHGGDVPSEYLLGLLLYECREAPVDDAALEREAEKIHQTRRRGSWDIDDPEIETRQVRELYADCAGVPVEARGHYREWIKSAADAGLLEAQLDVMYHLPQGEFCQYLYQCTPAQRKDQAALQAESLHYMTLARNAGSVSALWTFGAWYQSDEVLPVSDVEAYAHYYALDQIQAAAGIDRRFGPMIQSLKAKLRPADLGQAEARATELLSNPRCCVLTP
jgi:TPR repeat protein